VKMDDRPESASIQLKAWAWTLELAAKKQRKPRAEAKMMATRGRSVRST